MAQVVLKISDDVGRMPVLMDGDHTLQFADSRGANQVKITVAERSTKFTIPTKDGVQTLDKAAFQQLLRDAIEKDSKVITIDPDPVESTDTKTSVATTETPWGLIIGAAAVGYLLGKNT